MRTFGLGSESSVVNKTLLDLATNDNAKKIIRYNQEVISSQSMRAHVADLDLNNKISFQSITMKFPLYDDTNKMIGLLGFGSVIEKHSLDDFVTQISQLGLLNSFISEKEDKSLSGIAIHGVCLSKRQAEILRFLTRGMLSKEIGKKLGLSYRTVQHYIDNIKMKLDVSTRSELIDKVIDHLH